ncbi:MAG: C25 family cysteine peptidase [Calditrichaceae bacterium]
MRIITNADSTSKLPQSLLNNGLNRLEIDMFQGGVSDVVLLNWFEITYLRKYAAYKNKIKFSVDQSFFNNQHINLGDPIQFTLNGFTSNDIDLYKIGTSKITNGLTKIIQDGLNTTYRLSFQDEVFDTNVEYIAVTNSAKLKPVSIKPYSPWINDGFTGNLLNTSNTAEYLIITDNLFYTNCSRLKNLKEADGYTTKIVTVENIYDTFNYGIKSPLAIKDFIKYVVGNWDNSNPLQYVVFVGDASYDYKGLLGEKTDFVPTFMYQTVDFGATGSDYWYSLLDADYIPDVIVSRIPVGNNLQLNNYIDKIEAYTQNDNVQRWRNRALFISGNDASGDDRELLTNQPLFRTQNQRLMDMQLPDDVFSYRLNTIKDETLGSYDPDFGSTTDLIEYFDDGVTFMNFLGHGGGNIWADVNLLNLNDVERLNNGSKLPFIASMTCFTGAYENPSKDGLAERLVLGENKGAIAMLASSGFGWRYNDMAIEWGLFDFLWDDLTFGQAVDMMKMYYLANPIYYTEKGSFYTLSYSSLNKTMVSQYNLLGDPALKIKQPQSTLDLAANNLNPVPGDSLKITISGGPSSGSGHVEVVNRKNLLIFAADFSHQSTGEDIQFRLADTLESDLLTIKGYVTDGIQDANGSLEIGLDKSIIKNITSTPANPKVGDSISFKIELASGSEIQSVKLYNFRDFDNLSNYNFNVTTRKISETEFESDVDLPGFTNSGLKYFDVLLTDTAGIEELYRWRKLTINDDRPDIKLVQNTLSYTGTNQLQLKFSIENDSDVDITDLGVSCYTDNGISMDIPFSESIVSVKAGEKKVVTVNFDSTTFKEDREFKVVLDPQNQFDERNEDNNIIEKQLTTDHILVQPDIGTTFNGVDNDTLTILNNWNFFVARDTLKQSSVVKFSTIDILDKFGEISQKELIPVRLKGNNDYLAAEINVGNYNENLNFQARLNADVSMSSDSLDRLSFYYFDTFLDLWVQMPSDTASGRLETTVYKPGLYAIFYNMDDKDPYIEISSNGRPLIQNVLVVRKPVISILLQDESGINLNNSFSLRLDDETLVSNGMPLNTEAVNYPDSLENSKSISILATPDLEAGEHTLTVDITDVNGNPAHAQVVFKVSAEFDIKVFGNYPNPFKEQTVISYFINSDNNIDKFSIKIYTTSGRLIRSEPLDVDVSLQADTNDPFVGPEYHELIWNGEDDDGYQVANGVYYAIIKGSYQGKTVIGRQRKGAGDGQCQ